MTHRTRNTQATPAARNAQDRWSRAEGRFLAHVAHGWMTGYLGQSGTLTREDMLGIYAMAVAALREQSLLESGAGETVVEAHPDFEPGTAVPNPESDFARQVEDLNTALRERDREIARLRSALRRGANSHDRGHAGS